MGGQDFFSRDLSTPGLMDEEEEEWETDDEMELDGDAKAKAEARPDDVCLPRSLTHSCTPTWRCPPPWKKVGGRAGGHLRSEHTEATQWPAEGGG